MREKLASWFRVNQVIFTNASSLVGTTMVTSGFGFIYWWLAARLFDPTAVGLASAIISAMMLFGTIGMLGLGTLLIGELSREPDKAGSLITTALVVAGTAGGILGTLFALITPWISAYLGVLGSSSTNIALFALGVSLTAVALVLDQAVIGLLRGGLQLRRNALFAVAKFVILLAVGLWWTERNALTIYITWVAGGIISLGAIIVPVWFNRGWVNQIAVRWELIQSLGRIALSHHGFNLALQAPALILPVLVTALLSAGINASFYVAWMIAGFIFVVPVSLTTVLYAIGAGETSVLAHKMRLTLGLSVIIGLTANAMLLVSADWVLHLFGRSYAEQAGWTLRILALGVFPLIIKQHYVAVCQIRNQVGKTMPLVLIGGTLELILAAIGANTAGLVGLSLGWVAATCIEALFMSRTIYRALQEGTTPIQQLNNKTLSVNIISHSAESTQ